MGGGGINPSISEADLHGFVDGELDRERREAVRAFLPHRRPGPPGSKRGGAKMKQFESLSRRPGQMVRWPRKQSRRRGQLTRRLPSILHQTAQDPDKTWRHRYCQISQPTVSSLPGFAPCQANGVKFYAYFTRHRMPATSCSAPEMPLTRARRLRASRAIFPGRDLVAPEGGQLCDCRGASRGRTSTFG